MKIEGGAICKGKESFKRGRKGWEKIVEVDEKKTACRKMSHPILRVSIPPIRVHASQIPRYGCELGIMS